MRITAWPLRWFNSGELMDVNSGELATWYCLPMFRCLKLLRCKLCVSNSEGFKAPYPFPHLLYWKNALRAESDDVEMMSLLRSRQLALSMPTMYMYLCTVCIYVHVCVVVCQCAYIGTCVFSSNCSQIQRRSIKESVTVTLCVQFPNNIGSLGANPNDLKWGSCACSVDRSVRWVHCKWVAWICMMQF